jgi:hypothetical protein
VNRRAAQGGCRSFQGFASFSRISNWKSSRAHHPRPSPLGPWAPEKEAKTSFPLNPSRVRVTSVGSIEATGSGGSVPSAPMQNNLAEARTVVSFFNSKRHSKRYWPDPGKVDD